MSLKQERTVMKMRVGTLIKKRYCLKLYRGDPKVSVAESFQGSWAGEGPKDGLQDAAVGSETRGTNKGME